MVPLEQRFPAPAGFSRVPVEGGSFAQWLRGLPVRTDRQLVLSHSGLPLPAPAAAVVVLDLGEGDLQQCADTILRLHAEYLWAQGRAEQAGYHFTSGDLSTWVGWVAGERYRVAGSRVERLPGPNRREDHGSYRSWLQFVFQYAGTLSLPLDSQPVPRDESLAAGDFFVQGGSPGHAVMVMDVAESGDGRRVGLIGQGYTPAQELHVLHDDGPEVVDRVWFALPDDGDGALSTPTWSPFPRRAAWRLSSP
jgi:hypothetical protein